MLIAFSGLKGSGKDTAAAILVSEYGFTKVALADPVRDFAYAINPVIQGHDQFGHVYTSRLQDLVDDLGWDRCKREFHEVRRTLQAVGTEGGRNLFGENFWIDMLQNQHPDLFSVETRYVLTDARFKNEGDFVQQHGGLLAWVERPGLAPDGHASETTELRDQADLVLNNETTVEELQEDVRFLVFMRGLAN